MSQFLNLSIATKVDGDVFVALDQASRTITAQQKQTNIEDLEELKDKLEDQKQQMDEINDFFIQAANSED